MSKTIKDKDGHSLVEVYDTDEIVANPTLDGSEGSLAGLQIGNTKYKVTSGSGGGVLLVDSLPEVGEEDTLYKTPDGKIWSCTNTTETETVCDLEVGKSFTLKDKILAGDIVGLCDKSGEGEHHLNITRKSGLAAVKVSPEDTGPVTYMFGYVEDVDDSSNSVVYDATNVPLTDLVTGELVGFRELPSIEITRLLVENLTNANLELLDLAFAFVGGSHSEEVTTSTWTEVGGSGSSGIQFVNIVSLEDSGVVILDKTNEEIMTALRSGLVAIKYSADSSVGYCIIESFSYENGRIYFSFNGESIIPYTLFTYNPETGEWHYSPIN